MPKLDKLLVKIRHEPQDWRAQLAIARAWTIALGGTIKKKDG